MNYEILQRYQDKLFILFPVGEKKKRETFGGKAKKNPVRILLRKSIL